MVDYDTRRAQMFGGERVTGVGKLLRLQKVDLGPENMKFEAPDPKLVSMTEVRILECSADIATRRQYLKTCASQ
jgi:hypothetical protein